MEPLSAMMEQMMMRWSVFYIIEKGVDRQAFDYRVYLAPVGNAQIDQYKDKGYTLTQTPGWN